MNISVIIPTINEENFIISTIQSIKRRAVDCERLEMVVADGGSDDGTIAAARNEGVTVITASTKRRSVQMNAGARASTHEMLFFLHADTQPPRHFDQCIIQSFHQGHPAGCFQLSFDSTSRLLAFYGWCTRFNIDTFRFGDQSLFVHRSAYESVGGFNEDYYLMEGHDLALRLKKDRPFAIINKQVTTSARKYNENGPLRLQLIYVVIVLLSKLGFAQPTLRALYHKWVQ